MRALVVTLKSPIVSLSSAEIFTKTGISISSVNRIYTKAIKQGFNPNVRPLVIKDKWVQDTPRSSRPQKQTPKNIEKVITKVRKNQHSREINYINLTGEFSTKGINILTITI